MPARIPLVLGAAQIGAAEFNPRVADPALAQAFVDLMLAHGHAGIDTSRIYCGGSSEQVLGTLDLRGVARVDTKVAPMAPWGHAPEKIRASLDASRAALNGKKIRVLYLHAPDRSVPFEETLAALDALHRAGYFEELGLSNYMAWEVAEVVGICARRGFVAPRVYEGIYNLLDRRVEDELFACLRKFGIRFAAFTPLAGGYLSDRFFVPGAQNAGALAKFDASNKYSWFYTSRYFPMAPAVAELLEVVTAHGLTLNEVALRWLQWHSMLRPGDHGIIVAASKEEQLQMTLRDCEKGPLPEAVVEACEETWRKVKGVAVKYWQ
ncbi:aldo/keto reductase [Phanerochaete sordida]|uniref:Aldo/keto reductase n=1 Tax=Phanerochaete sordida TaxID=48140 RepID=A0A9P3LEU4_9APHY|nr:aldo/keto reductase [Phanerochaete sordida]